MDILYDHQIFAIQKFGGISRIFIELMREFSRQSDFSIHWHRGIQTDDYDISEYRNQLKRYWAIQRMPFKLLGLTHDDINRFTFKWFGRTLGRKYDVYHPSYYDDSLLEIVQAENLAVTICDMIPEKFLSENPQLLNKFKQVIQGKKALAERAEIIFVISQNTKNDLVEILKVDPQKVKVTYLASRIKDFSVTELPEICRSKPYFLYVGTRSKYKNFEIVMQAFAASPQLRANFQLVCFGGSCEFLKPELKFMAENNIRENFIYLRGDDSLLKTLYSNAQALVYTSRYEGFGLPPLEAMECQCPVICCQNSSLPEVVGDAAVFFNPDSVEELVAYMKTVVEDTDKRALMLEKGQWRASLFSWEKVSRLTLEGYREII